MSTSSLRDGTYFLSNESMGLLMKRWDDDDHENDDDVHERGEYDDEYEDEEDDEYDVWDIEFSNGNVHKVLLGTYKQGTARKFEFK